MSAYRSGSTRWLLLAVLGATTAAGAAVLSSRWAVAREPIDAPASAPAAGPRSDVSGVWHNQLSSQIEMKYDPATHALTGTYENHAAPAQPPFQKVPLVGTVNGDVVSWTVNWGPQFGSITAWVGHVYVNKHGVVEINTMWHLARPIESPDKVWMGVLDGSDTFTPGPVNP